MGVVDQLWHHCYSYNLYVFRLINRGNLLFVVIILLRRCISCEIDVSKLKYDKMMTSLGG